MVQSLDRVKTSATCRTFQKLADHPNCLADVATPRQGRLTPHPNGRTMITPHHPAFSTAVLLGAICKLLDLDPVKVVAAAGLPARIVKGHGVLISEEEFFLLWDTIVRLGNRPDFTPFVGKALANGATSPVFFALSCAPNLQTGLERFARFKHVFGPLGMSVRLQDGALRVRLVPLRPDGAVPTSIAGPILTFLHEKARSCTARPLIPEAVHLPAGSDPMGDLGAVFGTATTEGEPQLVYSARDASCRLVSENVPLWAAMEADLMALVAVADKSIPLVDRVRSCLIEAISDGDPSIAFVCERLGKSRSSLLRDLQANGQTFQGLLEDTRKTLALRYLRNSSMPVKQVANLLAYRDPNAFYRAFKSWTGLTPSGIRKMGG